MFVRVDALVGPRVLWCLRKQAPSYRQSATRMRPDSVAGGAACVIAALGLLAASYMSLMVPYSAVEVGVCTQDYFAIRANAPCKGEDPVAAVPRPSTAGAGGTRGAGVASSGPLPGVGGACHRLQVQVTVVPVYDGEPDELGSFKASVTPAAGVACTSQAECMAVLQVRWPISVLCRRGAGRGYFECT